MARKPNAFQGFAIVATLVVLALVIAWLAYGGSETASQALSLSQTKLSSGVEQANVFYNYSSPEGFSLRYPVGFLVEEPESGFASFRASASGADHAPDIIEVIIDNSTTASDAFQEALQESREAGLTASRVYTNSAGKLVRFIQTTATVFPENEFVTQEDSIVLQGYVDCTKFSEESEEKTTYAALVLAVIPQSLEADVALARQVVDSFRC